jgi:D-serine deaminase-like pyridoxal phosphate-dependent protein
MCYYRKRTSNENNEAIFLPVMLSDFDSYVHRSDRVKDFSSEAHSSMALRIYDLYEERYI